MKKFWLGAIIIASVFRFFTFGLAALAPTFLSYQPSFAYPHILLDYQLPAYIYSFAGFDGVHYLVIAEQGYRAAGLIQAFFPVWPLLLALGANFNTIVWGLVYNFSLLIILIMVWQRFVEVVYPEFFAKLSRLKNFYRYLPTVLLLTLPTSFFLTGLYSETLFLTLVLGAFLAAHFKNWKLTVLLTIIASATRIVGVVLVPALLLEYFWQQNQLTTTNFTKLKSKLAPQQLFIFIKNHFGQLLLISFGSLGLLTYMAYLYWQFGDPFLFKSVQSDWGQERSASLVMYPQVVWRYLKMFAQSAQFTLGWWSIGQELIFGLVAPWLPLLFFKKIRPSHLLFGWLVAVIPTLTGTFASLPRYSLAAFPIFLSLLWLLKDRPKLLTAWLLLSTLALICNTILFIQGYWVA